MKQLKQVRISPETKRLINLYGNLEREGSAIILDHASDEAFMTPFFKASQYALLGRFCGPAAIPGRMNELKNTHPEVFVAVFANAIRQANKGQKEYQEAIDFYFSYDKNNIDVAVGKLQKAIIDREQQKLLK